MRRLFSLILLTLSGSIAAAPSGMLNDTGQTQCYDASKNVVDCATVAADGGARPGQDGRYGRDAAAAAGALTKVGGGLAGFDFTKLCMSGYLAGQGSCAADPQTTDPDPWACTKDNHTNLIWSIETITTTLANATTIHAESYNSSGRCGFNGGWRLPTRRELLSIVHFGVSSPAIDRNYFPSTSGVYWNSDCSSSFAWFVDFGDGVTRAWRVGSTTGASLHLVVSGQ